jgi:hypothetical protein
VIVTATPATVALFSEEDSISDGLTVFDRGRKALLIALKVSLTPSATDSANDWNDWSEPVYLFGIGLPQDAMYV